MVKTGQSWALWRGALAALLVAVPGIGAAAAGPENSQLKQMIDAARKEGQLSIVTGEGTLGGSNSGLLEGFNKYYGLDLDVRFTPGPPMPSMAAKVIQAYQTNRPAVTDVLVGYANHMMTAIQAKAVQKGDWQSWAPNLQKPGLVSPEGIAVPVTTSIQGIAYNTNVFKGDAVPTKLQDLLNPKLKGRVATTPYASGFDRLSTKDLWGVDKTMSFARALSAQVSGLIRCNEMDRLASGEFDVFGLTCSQNNALAAAGKGAPVGFAMASDAPIMMYLYQAVPATAAHPNAAKLWINYLSSPEAQKVLSEVEYADLSLIDGSKTAESIRALKEKGVKFLVVDTDFYRTHNEKEMRKVISQVQKIFRSRR